MSMPTTNRKIKKANLAPSDPLALRYSVEQQIGRGLKLEDQVDAVEATVIYRWQIELSRPLL